MRLALLTAILCASLLPAQEPPPGVPTFPSAVDLITVDAVVVDKDGRPVSGLTRDDFAVSEDGRPQEIATFEAVDQRREEAAGERAAGPSGASSPARSTPATGATFVLLVDDVGMIPSRQADVRRALERFLATGVRDGDEVMFSTASGTWWNARLPEGREDLLALVGRVRGRNLLMAGNDAISDWEAYRIVHDESPLGSGGANDDQAVAATVAQAARGQPGTSAAIPGTSTLLRVVERYYARRVCDPDPAGTPDGLITPVSACRQMVLQRAQEMDRRRTNHTLDVIAAVDRAVFALSGVRGRKALLLLSEGFVNDPDMEVARDVAAHCREANIAVYSLDVRGLITGLPGAESAGSPNVQELGLMQMEAVEFAAAGSVALAEDTGGLAIRDSNDLAAGAQRVAEESRVYYLIGYTPPPGKGPRDWRRLKVEVKRPGLTVRARKGYTLRTSADIQAADEARIAARARRDAKGATGEPPVPVAVARALASPRQIEDIPVRAMAYVFDPRPGGKARTIVTVEVDTRAIANLGGEERARAVLSLSIAATHRDSGETRHVDQRIQVEGGETATWQGWLSVNREFELPPGVVQARVVVRDEFLGRVGAATTRFVVPDTAGMRVSTPVLTARTWRRQGMAPQPVLVARREFEASGPLYCYFQVFREGDAAVFTTVELRHRGGAVVRQDPRRAIEPTADGRLIRFFNFPLDGLAPGDYELRVEVEKEGTGETREDVESLRITS